MGNSCRKPQNPKLEELEKRLKELEGVDRDGDGTVSKNEFESWKSQQKADLEMFRQEVIQEEKIKHQKELIKKDGTIKDLKKEIKALKKMYADLQHQKAEELKDRVREEMEQGELSEQQIALFVEELLGDDAVNIDYFPDFVERKIYINVFNILLGLIRKTLGNTSIKFIGHEITLKMKPQAEEK